GRAPPPPRGQGTPRERRPDRDVPERRDRLGPRDRARARGVGDEAEDLLDRLSRASGRRISLPPPAPARPRPPTPNPEARHGAGAAEVRPGPPACPRAVRPPVRPRDVSALRARRPRLQGRPRRRRRGRGLRRLQEVPGGEAPAPLRRRALAPRRLCARARPL